MKFVKPPPKTTGSAVVNGFEFGGLKNQARLSVYEVPNARLPLAVAAALSARPLLISVRVVADEARQKKLPLFPVLVNPAMLKTYPAKAFAAPPVMVPV